MIKQLNKFQVHCFYYPMCEFTGKVEDLEEHILCCKSKEILFQNLLYTITDTFKEILELEIKPHLVTNHKDIFDNYIKNFEYLLDDSRDWKWFWWSDNPWWNNQPCEECIILSQKYEHFLDFFLEKLRRRILKVVNNMNKLK